jgi:hypothetical protein
MVNRSWVPRSAWPSEFFDVGCEAGQLRDEMREVAREPAHFVRGPMWRFETTVRHTHAEFQNLNTKLTS